MLNRPTCPCIELLFAAKDLNSTTLNNFTGNGKDLKDFCLSKGIRIENNPDMFQNVADLVPTLEIKKSEDCKMKTQGLG